ncbi:hypothetical protein ACH41E_23915 [Streptomyces sp. NPDC020412]|uniref:hypothetical protein n=1 Tax=Streptomyces sp. NPDC020412 TaxID=3365073 RepID=UPI0037BB85DB
MKSALRRHIAVAGALALLPLMTVAAHAEDDRPPSKDRSLSADALAAMSPEQQGKVLAPLRATAGRSGSPWTTPLRPGATSPRRRWPRSASQRRPPPSR